MNKHNEMVKIDRLDGGNDVLSKYLLSGIDKVNVILKNCRTVSILILRNTVKDFAKCFQDYICH